MKTKKSNSSHDGLVNQCPVASQEREENQSSIANQSTLQQLGRIVAGSYYDHQQVRIQEMNRIRDIIRRKVEGIPTETPEKKKEDKDKFKSKFVDKNIPDYLKELVSRKEITDKEEKYILKMFEVQKNAEKYEKEYKKLMMEFVESEKIYQEFLLHIRGISAVLSANLIKEFGYCENAIHISSLWKYCGMHVVDGEAPKRKKGVKLDFNLRLRTMVWKIGDSFIKQRTPLYRDIYDKEKAKQVKLMEDNIESKEISKPSDSSESLKARKPQRNSESMDMSKPLSLSVPKSLMHCDLRARRKMIKIFLAHYWQACKEINESLSICKPQAFSESAEYRKPNKSSEPMDLRKPYTLSEKPYVSAKMGHKHISNWKEAVKKNLANRIKKTIQS